MHPTDDKKYPIKNKLMWKKDFCVQALSSRKLEINDSMEINSFVVFFLVFWNILYFLLYFNVHKNDGYSMCGFTYIFFDNLRVTKIP